AGVLVSGTNGIVVAAGANDRVRLVGLDFVGLGTGINGVNFISGKSLRIEDCDINGFTIAGVNFQSTTANAQMVIQNSSIDGQIGGTGVAINPASTGQKTTIRHTSIDDNTNGLGLNGPGNPAVVTLTNSDVSFNAGGGIVATGVNAMLRM